MALSSFLYILHSFSSSQARIPHSGLLGDKEETYEHTLNQTFVLV